MDQHIALINSHGNTVKDVPAKAFIEAFAKHLKKGNKIKVPTWASYVKTSCSKELPPIDYDWLFTRAASVAYQLYIRQKTGVNTLRKHYGKRQRVGTMTEHCRLAAGKNIRYCLKQLEVAGLVGAVLFESEEGTKISMGKSLTKKGRTDMDRIAVSLIKELKK